MEWPKVVGAIQQSGQGGRKGRVEEVKMTQRWGISMSRGSVESFSELEL
jgi:hypothetical protein